MIYSVYTVRPTDAPAFKTFSAELAESESKNGARVRAYTAGFSA